jgi:ATP phosphoribosyltransferase regulatory subunit
MDLRQLAGLVKDGARRPAILAPHTDDATLQDLVRKLRSQGEIVVVALPGHDAAELGCSRKLAMEGGKWTVTNSGSDTKR